MIPDIAMCINLDERKDRWADFQKQELPFPVQRIPAFKDSIGWFGCRVSYLNALKQAKGLTFIMEDDCLFLKDWAFISSVMEQLPTDWDLLYLGATLNQPLQKYSDNLYVIKNGWTTHAILYNGRKVPDYILSMEKHIRKIDVFLAKEIQDKFKCFITYPLTATQKPSYSNVINRDQDYAVIKERYDRYVK
jgi:hypothetical protein